MLIYNAESNDAGIPNATTYHLYNLSWVTERPKEDGWYWVNFRVGSTNIPVIVNYPLNGSEANMELATHWMGPLPVPELPEKVRKE